MSKYLFTANIHHPIKSKPKQTGNNSSNDSEYSAGPIFNHHSLSPGLDRPGRLGLTHTFNGRKQPLTVESTSTFLGNF